MNTQLADRISAISLNQQKNECLRNCLCETLIGLNISLSEIIVDILYLEESYVNLQVVAYVRHK